MGRNRGRGEERREEGERKKEEKERMEGRRKEGQRERRNFLELENINELEGKNTSVYVNSTGNHQ